MDTSALFFDVSAYCEAFLRWCADLRKASGRPHDLRKASGRLHDLRKASQ